ncbi:MAG: hypothetical protein DWQ05_00465 [Calditrichaeota bacterium]|nr:MAG: hypothetical protein DWQ05_00465 [Calditrichota bacterium]
MQALGGRENWDNTRYITWKFFGRRLHIWDKFTGTIRIESGKHTVVMNVHTQKGRLWEFDQEVTYPDSVAKYVEEGYHVWINDSYWLVMPYKLKDRGVTLKYLGEREMDSGAIADVLQLTFTNVGVTPENKYEVYVNKENKRVEQWSYFSKSTDTKARFTTPWLDWQKYGKIYLSSNRGKRDHTDIAVFDELPASIFENPERLDILSFPQAAH